MDNPKLTKKQRLFIDEYLKCFNAADAARKAGYSEHSAYSQGWENLRKPEIKAEIDTRLDEVHMSADEALKILADIGHGDVRVFFKVVEEWTFYPLPTYEIIGQKEVVDDSDPAHPKTQISYWVRHVAIDMDKVIDPQYSHLIREFTDSPKNGLGIKLYDKHAAARDVLKIAGKFTEKVDITSGGEKVIFEVVRAQVPDTSTHASSEAKPISEQSGEAESDRGG